MIRQSNVANFCVLVRVPEDHLEPASSWAVKNLESPELQALQSLPLQLMLPQLVMSKMPLQPEYFNISLVLAPRSNEDQLLVNSKRHWLMFTVLTASQLRTIAIPMLVLSEQWLCV